MLQKMFHKVKEILVKRVLLKLKICWLSVKENRRQNIKKTC